MNVHRIAVRAAGIAALCLVLAACERKVPLSEIPQQILDAARGAVPGLTVAEAEMEREDGADVYEIEGTSEGKEYEIEVSADGKVLEVETADDDADDAGDDAEESDDEAENDEDETEIPLSDVPEAVRNAASAAVPGIALAEAEVEEENGAKVYEIEGTAQGKEYEIEVSADGKVLEVETADDDDADDAEESEDEAENDENETEIPLSDVPEAVRNAASAAVPGIALAEAEVEEENGAKVYELEGVADGEEYEIEVSADGKVLEVEKDEDDD